MSKKRGLASYSLLSIITGDIHGLFRKTYLLLLLCYVPLAAYSQSTELALGNFSFSLSPKIMEDGSFTDIGVGLDYTDKLRGELRFRYTITSKNEEVPATADSLNAVKENIFEVFLLPLEYTFVKTANSKVWAGGGLYYEHDKKAEKGFFNMPSLEDRGHERVNSYTNDFSMHIIGPLIDAGVNYRTDWLNTSLSAGIVPLFFLASSQKMGIVPLLGPDYADYTQNTWGSPYFYAQLDSVFFKYVNLVFLYDVAQLRYQYIQLHRQSIDNYDWIHPESTVLRNCAEIT
jgi:hypothetical protein